MLKVIWHLYRSKVPLSGLPSSISLISLPHRCHRLSGTWWGDYPIHLSQDEGQVDLFSFTQCSCLLWGSGYLWYNPSRSILLKTQFI
jgi:hypothetical protein